MSHPSADDEPLDPAAARMVAKVRTLMLIAGLTTMLAIAAVLGVIGYLLFTLQGSVAPAPAMPPDVTAQLPQGARVVSTASANDRIVVTIEVSGRIEIRTFDLRSLKPAGRLQLQPAP
jgi:hypothetical protein